MKSLALSATHWTSIKLVAAWGSGYLFARAIQLSKELPRGRSKHVRGRHERHKASGQLTTAGRP